MLVRLVLIAAVLIGVATLSLGVITPRRKASAGLFAVSIALALAVVAIVFASGVTTPHRAERAQASQTDDT